MADSIREKIIQAVEVELKKIARYDDANIVRGKTFFKKDELPGMAIFPGTETATKEYGKQKCVMPVEISTAVICGDVNVSVMAETLMAEIIDTIIPGMRTNEFIDSIAYTGGGVDNWPDVGDQAVSVTVNVDLTYFTALGDPYNQ